MGKMSIPAALKRKNRLVKRLAQLIQRMQSSNVHEEGETVEYNSEDLLEKVRDTADELAAIKAAIQESNAENNLFGDIMRLAELKGLVKALESLDCQGGKHRNRYRDENDPVWVTSVAQISSAKRDELMDELQAEIDKIDDRLQLGNAKAKIDDDAINAHRERGPHIPVKSDEEPSKGAFDH